MYYGSGTVAHTESAHEVTDARRASGQPADAAAASEDPIWNDGALRLISITAARCVAWHCVARETETLSAYYLSPRNARRSLNRNKTFGVFWKKLSLMWISRTTKTTRWVAIGDQFLIQKLAIQRWLKIPSHLNRVACEMLMSEN